MIIILLHLILICVYSCFMVWYKVNFGKESGHSIIAKFGILNPSLFNIVNCVLYIFYTFNYFLSVNLSFPIEIYSNHSLWIWTCGFLFTIFIFKGAWVAQLVKCPTLDFSLGHDLTFHELKPCTGFWTDNVESAWVSLPLFLPLPPFKINKL